MFILTINISRRVYSLTGVLYNHSHLIDMKKLITIMLLLPAFSLFPPVSNAQTTTDDHTFFVETPIYLCDILGNKLSDSVYISPKFSNFTKIAAKGSESVVISFWNYNDSTRYRKFNASVAKPDEKRFFLVSQEDFANNTKARYHLRPSFTAGTVIIPIKIRFSEFDFSKDITLGTTVGARMRLSSYADNYANLLVGFGVSSVSLDSLSTSGTIMQPVDRSALTPSLGFVLEFASVQVGIFTGIDYISDNSQTNWRYHGKPWLSTGFGYSILSRQSQSTQNSNQNQPNGL